MTRILGTPPIDYFIEAVRGSTAGVTYIDKFGRNIEIDSGVVADIWDGGHTGDEALIWVAPTTARIHNIKSSSTSDDGDPAGVGARTIKIYGLTGWDTAEVTEDITLNGTNNVATANSYVIIHRMEILTKGATNVNVGLVTATAQTDGTITAQIRASQGQTQMAVYGIPSTQTLYLGRFYANVNKAGGAAGLIDVALCWNPEPDSELNNFLIKHTFGLQTVGTSAFSIPYYTPKKFVGSGILKIQVTSGTANMDVSAGFDGVLINN